MNINELPELLKRLDDHAKRDKTLQDLLDQLGQTLADLLAHQEASGPAMAKAIADAFKSASANTKTAAPAPIHNHVSVPEIRPVIHVVEGEKAKSWKHEPTYDQQGRIKSIVSSRI